MKNNLSKSDFVRSPEVHEFCDYLCRLLPRWHVAYQSEHRRLKNRSIEIRGVTQALAKYSWPADFICPEDIELGGVHYGQGSKVVTDDWSSSQSALALLRNNLRRSIENGMDADVISWSDCILKWGMGTRGESAKRFLRTVQQGAVSNYLASVDEVIREDDLARVNSKVVPKFNSGLSKVHSLASDTQTLVIFDSRVALALGTAINHFLVSQNANSIPDALSISRALDRTPAVSVNGINQPVLTRDYRWLQSQMKVSWMLEETLKRSPNIFEGSIAYRLHCLEAALFMIGTQPNAVKEGLENSFV